MLGISASIFNEAGGLVKDWLKNPLNSSFFYWYFLPAVGFVLLQLFVVAPALGRPIPAGFKIDIGHNNSMADLILQVLNASFFQLILIPLVAAVLMSALSGRVFRLYQGTLPITRPFFKPWLERNRKLNSEIFGQLQFLRRQYIFLVSKGLRLEIVNGETRTEEIQEQDRPALIHKMKLETQALHDRLDSDPRSENLPVEYDRVGPTDLANTLSKAEEYPVERYSMDTAVFWPRLSAEIEPEKLEALKYSFAAMNGLLNLSLLIYVFAIEAGIVGVLIASGITRPSTLPLLHGRPVLTAVALVVAAVCVLIAFGAYRSAVSSARTVGNAMRTAFDYYRGNVLRRFNLKMPQDIEEERVVWLRLAAFIRRGESFYYPSEFRCE